MHLPIRWHFGPKGGWNGVTRSPVQAGVLFGASLPLLVIGIVRGDLLLTGLAAFQAVYNGDIAFGGWREEG